MPSTRRWPLIGKVFTSKSMLCGSPPVHTPALQVYPVGQPSEQSGGGGPPDPPAPLPPLPALQAGRRRVATKARRRAALAVDLFRGTYIGRCLDLAAMRRAAPSLPPLLAGGLPRAGQP